MKRNALRMFCLVGLLAWMPCTCIAADPSPSAVHDSAGIIAEPSETVDLREPSAIAELKRATDFLTSLSRFHVKVSINYNVFQSDGRLLQFEKTGDVFLQRPDRFFADIRFDDGRWRKIWYDGKMLSIAALSKNLHTRIKVPPTIDATLDILENLFKEPQPFADLLYSDLSPIDQLALEADNVGDSLVNGRPCSHLAFRGKTIDWQIWVEQGTTPFIRKLVISYREEPGKPQSVVLVDLWETPDQFNDSLFEFIVPPDSQWMKMLMPMPRMTDKGGRP